MRPELKLSGTPKRSEPKKPILCRLVLADLKACLDQELPAFRKSLVVRHLQRCSECGEEAAWLRRLGEDMQVLEQAVPHERLRARILANLPDAPARVMLNRPARPVLLRLAFGGAAAGLAMGVCFALLLNKIDGDKKLLQIALIQPEKPNEHVALQTKTTISKENPTSSLGADPSLRLPDDPLTIAADAIVAKQEAERTQKDLALSASNRNAIKKLAEGAPPKTSEQLEGQKTLIFAVSDRNSAQANLIKWAQDSGGYVASSLTGGSSSVAGSSRMNEVAPSVMGATAPAVQIPAQANRECILLALRIPKKSLASLPAFMKKLGAPAVGKRTQKEKSAADSSRFVQVPRSSPLDVLHPSDQQSSRDNSSLVTVMIELQEIHRER